MKENETRLDTQALYELAVEFLGTLELYDEGHAIVQGCLDVITKLETELSPQLRGTGSLLMTIDLNSLLASNQNI